MENIKELQLSLWREACQHIDLADSIPNLAAVIAAHVQIDDMRVFALERDRCLLVASLHGAQPGAFVEGVELGPIARFAQRAGLTPLDPRQPARSPLLPLCPFLGGQPVVCAGLRREGRAEGVVAWRLAGGALLDERASVLLSGALEPLAVAVDTSRRFHELEDLRRAAEAESQSALRRLGRRSLHEPIVGERGGLRSVMDRVDLVAGSDVPVLILGETGSGKEVVARAIHDRSRRHAGPFLRVNCGAIPPELVDSQLFGHERGAFTGAIEQRQGWFERASGGTLFLDEAAELPLAAQVRLLRVLQDGALERVGAQQTIKVDCRIVAATHRDLAQMVRERAFREDLWYRLAVFPLVLPPLRERQEDLPELVRHFAHRASLRFGLPELTIGESDHELLRAYPWPGNIRELAAVVDRAALLGQHGRLDLPAAFGGLTLGAARSTPARQPAGTAPVPTLEAAVRTAIETALLASGGRVEGEAGAARLLAVNPSTLRSKMRKLAIRSPGPAQAVPPGGK